VDIELDTRIALQEVAQIWRDVQAAERRGHRHLEQAARPRVAATDKILRLVAQAQDIDHSLEVACTGLRQGEMAGRALK
jgi:hypothetical protein